MSMIYTVFVVFVYMLSEGEPLAWGLLLLVLLSAAAGAAAAVLFLKRRK